MMTYGYSVKEKDDHYVEIVEAVMSGFSESLEPGAFLVDMIPSREWRSLRHRTAGDANFSYPSLTPVRLTLRPSVVLTPSSILFIIPPPFLTVRHVPDWFPGTRWKANAKRLKKLLDEMADIPLQLVRDQMVSR